MTELGPALREVQANSSVLDESFNSERDNDVEGNTGTFVTKGNYLNDVTKNFCSEETADKSKLKRDGGGEDKVVGNIDGRFISPCSLLTTTKFPSNILSGQFSKQMKLKLIHEGDVLICFVNHSKTVINKVLTSKLLRRWENHHIYLQDDLICSKVPTGILQMSVPYSNILQVHPVGNWDQTNQYYLRIFVPDGSILLQVGNAWLRNQWLFSILWKRNIYRSKNVLLSSTKPEIVLLEIKNIVNLTNDVFLQSDNIIDIPISIITDVLLEDKYWTYREWREQAIIALSPLLERITPSAGMFHFFSQHCQLHPKSPVIIDVFTSLVHRILKRTFDFGRSPFMRKFVIDYITSIYQQSGEETVKMFVSGIHGANLECPHPRVLQNLVAVNLSAVFLYFEELKVLLKESGNKKTSESELALSNQLHCHIACFRAISEFDDWRLGLAQLLQPLPFHDDALHYEIFIEGFIPVIKIIGTDPKCAVHETVLGVGDNREGWLDVYAPLNSISKDKGQLWCEMLEALLSCCCRRKGFLKQKIMRDLDTVISLGLRGREIALDILCLMLEWNLIKSEDQGARIVRALESSKSGKLKYSALCERQGNLRTLDRTTYFKSLPSKRNQKKMGPKKLTMPIRSTDEDVAQLFSSGSFGNLECLSLAFTHVTSSCAYHLIQLPTLKCLNLWATHFGDAGLIVIAEHLEKLQVLNLCETPVTDKGISAIAGMKSLKKLNLNSTKLSPQTLEILKKQLPGLQELDVRYTDAW